MNEVSQSSFGRLPMISYIQVAFPDQLRRRFFSLQLEKVQGYRENIQIRDVNCVENRALSESYPDLQ